MQAQLEGTCVSSYMELGIPLLHLSPLGEFPHLLWFPGAPFSGPSGQEDGVLSVL